jgi:single-strand DNA-binding protein
MARSINQVNLMGRLTRDPEVRSTSSGKTIASFSIAVDRPGKDDATDFFDVTVWEKLAEIVAQYTKKGSKVYVSGRLQLDRWETDGDKRSKISVVANDVVFLESASDSGAQGPVSQNKVLETAGEFHPTAKEVEKPIDLSEIPF